MSVHVPRQVGATPIAGFDGPPLLIVGGNVAGRRCAAELAEGLGQRLFELEATDLPSIEARLRTQAAARGVWLAIEVGSDPAAVERVAHVVNDLACERGWPAVIEAPAWLIDPLAARVTHSRVELLIEPNEIERIAAMGLLASGHQHGEVLHDVTSEPSSARLRQLSDEVSRIASTLARLSAESPVSAAVEKPADAGDTGLPLLSGETVRSVIRARRLRDRYFDAELFADPAWDMLLDLLQSEISQHRVPVSSLCIAASVPATTALRWIKSMSDAGVFVRRPDPHDGRRVFIELAPTASKALRLYFADIGSAAVI